MKSLMTFLSNMFRENTQESFGRVVGGVFLLGSFGLSVADGIASLIHHQSALDASASLAVTGWSLFTMSKALHIRGQKVSLSAGAVVSEAAPQETPTEEPA